MSQTKSIIINSQDFSNIETVFFHYLTQKEYNISILNTIQSIIDQSIDKPQDSDLLHGWTRKL